MVFDDLVGLDQQRARRRVNAGEREHQPLQLGHVERRRGALPRHVGDEQADAAVGQRQKIVVVAADLSRGRAQRRDRHARRLQRAVRQQRHLDVARDLQLLLEPPLLVLLDEQMLDAARHVVERRRELAELVVRSHGDALLEVSALDALGAPEQLVDRGRDRARQRETVAQRDHLDDQQQHADPDQHEEQRSIEVQVLSPFRFPPSQLYSVGTSTLMAIRVCSDAPLSQST